jgi:hypothetical protein
MDGPQVLMTLTGPSSVQGFQTTYAGTPVYECSFELTSTVVGGNPGEIAYWTGGSLKFVHYDGTIDYKTLTVAEVENLMEAQGGVASGQPFSVTDYFYTGTDHPFQLTIVFDYAASGNPSRPATYSMSCT